MKAGNPWGKFFWADWESDATLKLCSLGAQGLWMRMLCVAAAHDPIGYIAVNGRGLGVTDIARLAGVTETEASELIAELDRNGVFSRDRHQRMYSRRMTRDAKKAAIARKNGKNGGNPSLCNKGGNKPSDNPTLIGGDKAHMPDAIFQNTLTGKSEPELEVGAGKPAYAFDGGTIKLKAADLAKWERAYPNVDLMAALQSRDDWFAGQEPSRRKSWFVSTSTWLAKLNGQNRSAAVEHAEVSMPC